LGRLHLLNAAREPLLGEEHAGNGDQCRAEQGGEGDSGAPGSGGGELEIQRHDRDAKGCPEPPGHVDHAAAGTRQLWRDGAHDTDPGDRRAAVVVLTVEGKKQLAAWESANERRVADALSRLSKEERAAITAALPGLRALAAQLR
jgi:hypothetical protein